MKDSLIDMIKKNEGTVKDADGNHNVYVCPAGKLTCGYGHNIEARGFSDDEVELMLYNDIILAIKEVQKIFPDFSTYSDLRQSALIDMMFNLGATRFRKFIKMIEAVKKENWLMAAYEAKNSKWYGQVGYRAVKNVHILKYGY